MYKYSDEAIRGKRFGRLVPVGPVGPYGREGQTCSLTVWLCECDCGSHHHARAASFVVGNTSSCGCLHRERAKTLGEISTHGMSGTPTYSVWSGMLDRVANVNNPNYAEYSKRGVCDRWLSFENFLADMGERPSLKHSIERGENDGPYAPWNCRWATAKEQANNRGNNVWLTINGVTQTASQWAEQNGLSPQTIWHRIKSGAEGRALIEPTAPRTSIAFMGTSKTMTQWAAEFGMSVKTLRSRLKLGWSVEEALTTPVGPTGRNRRAKKKL